MIRNQAESLNTKKKSLEKMSPNSSYLKLCSLCRKNLWMRLSLEEEWFECKSLLAWSSKSMWPDLSSKMCRNLSQKFQKYVYLLCIPQFSVNNFRGKKIQFSLPKYQKSREGSLKWRKVKTFLHWNYYFVHNLLL